MNYLWFRSLTLRVALASQSCPLRRVIAPLHILSPNPTLRGTSVITAVPLRSYLPANPKVLQTVRKLHVVTAMSTIRIRQASPETHTCRRAVARESILRVVRALLSFHTVCLTYANFNRPARSKDCPRLPTRRVQPHSGHMSASPPSAPPDTSPPPPPPEVTTLMLSTFADLYRQEVGAEEDVHRTLPLLGRLWVLSSGHLPTRPAVFRSGQT